MRDGGRDIFRGGCFQARDSAKSRTAKRFLVVDEWQIQGKTCIIGYRVEVFLVFANRGRLGEQVKGLAIFRGEWVTMVAKHNGGLI
ncbi:MAG: hypothetical protein WA705_12485 [Candidatus Ozemobacteraceae bacterium]